MIADRCHHRITVHYTFFFVPWRRFVRLVQKALDNIKLKREKRVTTPRVQRWRSETHRWESLRSPRTTFKQSLPNLPSEDSGFHLFQLKYFLSKSRCQPWKFSSTRMRPFRFRTRHRRRRKMNRRTHRVGRCVCVVIRRKVQRRLNGRVKHRWCTDRQLGIHVRRVDRSKGRNYGYWQRQRELLQPFYIHRSSLDYRKCTARRWCGLEGDVITSLFLIGSVNDRFINRHKSLLDDE